VRASRANRSVQKYFLAIGVEFKSGSEVNMENVILGIGELPA
jgi:hypothetical protein